MTASFYFSLVLVVLAATLSLLFSTWTFALRDFSRPKLSEKLTQLNLIRWFEPTVERSDDLIFVTAIARMFANLFVFIGVLHMLRQDQLLGIGYEWTRYFIAAVCTSVITLFVSIAMPHALAEHVGETLLAYSVRSLHGLRIAILPITKVMHATDALVRTLAGRPKGDQSQLMQDEIEQEILSVVEAGEKEGVVDEQEREMIQSVMEFDDTTVSQAMTERPDIMGVPINAKLAQIKSVFEESGHSRLPVYDGTYDKIVGLLYARDLIKKLGELPDKFDLTALMRTPFFTSENKSLRDLLDDFREHKTHLAIALDEYGGTAGLITIEDVFRQLVGEVSDEHEPAMPSLIRRIDDQISEVDGRILIDQLNRVLSLEVPEDAGYETLGGFVTTTMGKIPEVGASFEQADAKFIIIDAQPQRVNRVRVEKKIDVAAEDILARTKAAEV